MTRFKLYPEERHWWSFNDYAAVLAVMQRLRPASVLEFGPGSSTLALIEGGASRIDCCEDNEHWASVYRERLEVRFPGIVTIRPYTFSDPVAVPGIEGQRYDLALIDGPQQTQRAAAIDYALQHCTAVLFPTEDDGHEDRSGLRTVARLAAQKYARTLEFMETGPLSGGFALLTC